MHCEVCAQVAPWETRIVGAGVPRTVKAVDTTQLIDLDEEAQRCGLNRNHGAGWLGLHAAESVTHYLWPVLVHKLDHRP